MNEHPSDTWKDLRRNLRDPLPWLSFLLFFVIVLLAVARHQPWRDEAQIWVLVRDLGLWGVIGQSPSEGAPPLWALMVMPLAKSGLPYAAQSGLHVGLALVTIFLLVFASPLPRSIRLLLPFSYYFLFEYSVVARNYILTALLLFWIAAIHGSRGRRPLLYGSSIALLACSNVHSFAMSCGLAALFAFDLLRARAFSWTSCAAIAITGLGVISVPWLLTPDATHGLTYHGWRWLTFSGAAAIWPGIQRETYALLWPLALAWIFFFLTLLRGWRARILVLSSWAWIEFIFLFKHSGALNHYGLILVFFLFGWWLDLKRVEEKERDSRESLRLIDIRLFLLLILVNVAYSALFYWHHRDRHFSGAAETASFIRQAGLEGKDMVAYPAYIGTALLPYLPEQRLYQMEVGQTGTFMTWTLDYFQGLNTPFPELYRRMIEAYTTRPNGPDWILFISDRPAPEETGWELMFHNTRPSIKEDEFYYLYRIRLPAGGGERG